MKWYKVFVSLIPQRKCEPFSASVAGTLLPSAISAVGGLASNAMSLFGAQSNRDWQEQENEKNRQWQEKMWNLQNEYNSPKHQRELLQEAGFNPYMYGKESPFVGAGSSGAPAMAGAPALPNFSNPLSGSAQLLQQGLQIESNVELQHMKSLQTVSDIMLNLYKEGGQKQVDDFMREFAPALKSINFEGSFFEQKLKKEFLSMDIANDRADLERSLIAKFGEQEAQKKLRAFDDEHNRVRAEINKMLSEEVLNYKRVEELGSEMARNFASAHLFGTQAGQIEALLPYLRAVAEDDSLRSFMDYDDKNAEYIMNFGKREQQRKPHSQSMTGWEEAARNNFVTAFIRGASSALPGLPPIMNKKVFSPQFRYDYGTKYQYINPTGQ